MVIPLSFLHRGDAETAEVKKRLFLLFAFLCVLPVSAVNPD
jgi:hypothetical protein